MFELYADKTQLSVRTREPLTSGSVNIYKAQFMFSADWDGLERTAVFKAGRLAQSVSLDGSGQCGIPWEALAEPGHYLMAGVCGRQGEDLVLPTVWANLGLILTGALPGEDSRPITPERWEQKLAKKGDALVYDGLNLSLMSGDEKLSTVQIADGGEKEPDYQFGHGLTLTGTTVSVDTVDDFKGDNTLPMTAAGVQTAVGNIEALLGTI